MEMRRTSIQDTRILGDNNLLHAHLLPRENAMKSSTLQHSSVTATQATASSCLIFCNAIMVVLVFCEVVIVMALLIVQMDTELF